MKNHSAILPIIDYSSSPTDFNRDAFSALQSKGGFILDRLAPSSTAQLLSAYDAFLQQPAEVKETFKGKVGLDNLQGFYPYGNFLIGSKTCHRYFIIRDSSGNLTHPLPPPYDSQISMQEAADQLHLIVDRILHKTTQALDNGFGLKGAFADAFQGCATITVADQYLPITQEKLLSWVAQEKLTKTEDGRIEAFLAHKDLVPLTILTYYNNQCVGLELNISQHPQYKLFKPLSLANYDPYNLQAVVLAGKMMENLTDGMIQSVEHRVVIKPMEPGTLFQRKAINTFFTLNPQKHPVLKPITNSTNSAHVPPVPMATFFAENGAKYLKNEQTRAVKKLQPEELAPYPTEDEIDQHETSHGTVYVRRK